MLQLDANVVAFRKIDSKLRQSCYNDFRHAIADFGLENSFKFTQAPLRITYLPTGAEILFKGMNSGVQDSKTAGIGLGSYNFSVAKDYQFN